MNPSSESEAMKNTSCSTSLFRDRELPAALDAIAAVGFPQVELNVREPHVYGSDDKEERRLHALFAEHPVRARTMHAPAGRSILAALDDEWRTESVAVLSGYLRLAGSLGLTEMVVHPIPNPAFVPDEEDPMLLQTLRDCVTTLEPCCQPSNGVRVTLENLPYPQMPLNNMGELRERRARQWVSSSNTPASSSGMADEIRAAGSRLCGTHIHDLDAPNGDSDHRSTALDSYDWTDIRQAFAEIGYVGPWTMAVSRPSHGESPDELAREISDWMAAGYRGLRLIATSVPTSALVGCAWS